MCQLAVHCLGHRVPGAGRSCRAGGCRLVRSPPTGSPAPLHLPAGGQAAATSLPDLLPEKHMPSWTSPPGDVLGVTFLW